MYEGPEIIGGTPDKNSLVALLRSLEESLSALHRRKEAMQDKSGEKSIDAQIVLLESKIREIKKQLDSLIDNS